MNGGRVRVAATWELGWNTPIKEVDLWEYVLREFSVEPFYVYPVSGIEHHYVRERRSIEDILSECQDATVVHVDERGETTLPEFEHPADALYVFGKVSLSVMTAHSRPGDLSVRIPTVCNLSTLWPHQAAGIVLYDRMAKSWR